MSAISTHSTHEMWIKRVRWLGGIIISHLKSFVYGQGVLLVSSWAMVAWWRFIMMLMMPWEGRHTHNNLQRLQQKIVLSTIKTLTRFDHSLVIEHQKMKFFNIDVNKIFVRYWIKTLKIWEGTTISLPVFKAWKLKKKNCNTIFRKWGEGVKCCLEPFWKFLRCVMAIRPIWFLKRYLFDRNFWFVICKWIVSSETVQPDECTYYATDQTFLAPPSHAPWSESITHILSGWLAGC